MDERDIIGHVAKLVDQCEDYLSEQEKSRQTALEYYRGEAKGDLAPDTEVKRSEVVSKDLRAAVKKLMPSIMRTLLSGGGIVKYEPVGEGDEDAASQATDYINHVVVPQSNADLAIYDAIQDALLLKTGILKWEAYTKSKAVVYEYTNLSDEGVIGLIDDPELGEVFDHEKTPETDPDVLALDPNARRHSFKLRRIEQSVDVRLQAVPRGSFLIYPNSESIEDSPIVGERLTLTRSDLVAMGYDKEAVYSLGSGDDEEDDDREERMGDDWSGQSRETSKALEEVEVYEVYVKLDQDGDGIAEIYRIVFGEGGEDDEGKAERVALEMEPVSEAPYATVVAERDAHEFEGHSLAEDLLDVQRVKTGLLRGTLDSISWQNNPQPAVDLSEVESADAVFNPNFGQPILLRAGGDAKRALQWMQPPFIASDTFNMLPYFDDVARERTGVTDASGGLDPEAFQNMTATSAQLMSEAGVAQAEMITRSLSRGIRSAFKGLLRLVIAHQDRPCTVRLNGNWVEYNPAHWNVDMDCTVNVGLGSGSRERDLSVLQMLFGLQREIVDRLGPDNPYVKPEQIYNTLEKIVEATGLASAAPFFTKPDPEEVAQKIAEAKNQPSVEQMKLQVQTQVEQAKADARKQVEQAQMQADLAVKDAERRKDLEIVALKAQVELAKHNDKMALEAAKMGMSAPQAQPVDMGGFLDEF